MDDPDVFDNSVLFFISKNRDSSFELIFSG